MRNWKATAPILIALLIAVSGSIFIYQWLKLQAAPKEVIKVESEAVVVAVAALDLPWGAKLESEMITTAPFFKESIPVGSFTNVDELNDRILILPLKQGEPIVEHRLAPASIKTGGVSAILKPGKRALAVKGDKVIGISGFINPGNRVDVLVTMKNPASKTQKTKLVLENILVLATGTQVEKNEKGNPAPVDVYTLEVTPEEGEKLSLAGRVGSLQFALRNIMDDEKVLTRGATISQTLASLTSDEPPRPPQKTKKPVVYKSTSVTTEVIKGNKVTKKRLKI